MSTLKVEKPLPTIPKGWEFSAKNKANFVVTVEDSTRPKGKKCVAIKSMALSENDTGDFSQLCGAVKYLGKRVRMSVWVKSDLSEGLAQIWLRIDGDWALYSRFNGTFDNMWPDRFITAVTNWKKYSLVVDVPESSTRMCFGISHAGKGTLWIADVTFEVVGKDVPLTGLLGDPRNLNFEEM